MDIDAFGLSDVGRKRKRNEDSFLVADLRKAMMVKTTSLSHEDQTPLLGEVRGELYVVADGMGGHVEGRRASRLAVKTLNRYVLNTMPWFFGLDNSQQEALESELIQAVQRCQDAMERELRSHEERAGMGTTLTMAYVAWPWMYVVHVGDSRCYIRRGADLHQITRDDTVAQALVDEGVMNEREAEESSVAHVLSQAIIAREGADMTPTVFRTTLSDGDTLVLCTDGLTHHVADESIAEILGSLDSAQAACEQLIRAANEDGGTDNITVIVAKYAAAG
jgi:protein phosphatase